ncbi:MAG: T9SS type A sorting domain-containing protein [Bacteroidetes bacterium]|nr:T9SS type A sorting domain-containing protein [Bacteroidota bacterium]
MKKLFLLLLFLPGVLKAQILPNLFSPYRLPDSKFRVDTIHFHQGVLKIQEYNIDANENATLQSIYDWQTKEGRFIKSSRTFPNNSGYNYFESQFEYDANGRPFQLQNFRRLKDQTLLEASGKDSLVYEANLLRYDYRVTGNQNPGYHTEYEYDTIFGLKASYIRDIPANTTFSGMFEVQSFYKPGLPSILHGYSDNLSGRSLSNVRYLFYDSLDRFSHSTDSVVLFQNLTYLGIQRVVYHSQTGLIDSIVQDFPLNNEYQSNFLLYDANNKVAQVKVYRQTRTEPFRLIRRFDFINPGSSVLDQTNTKPNFSLYPNPALETLYIHSNQPIEAVEVYQYNGSLVLQQQMSSGSSIDISGLAPGMYLLKITTPQSSGYSNFVKQP